MKILNMRAVENKIAKNIGFLFAQETLIKHLLKAYSLRVSIPISITLTLLGQAIISLNFFKKKHYCR